MISINNSNMNTTQSSVLNLHQNQLPTIHHQTVNYNSSLFNNSASNLNQQNLNGFNQLAIKNVTNSSTSMPLLVMIY